MQFRLICAIGPIGSGKDYLAEELETEGYQQIKIASLLTDIAWATLGWEPKNNENYEKFKDNIISMGHVVGKPKPNHPIEFPALYLTGRQYLQNLGDALKKHLGDDVLCRAFETKIRQLKEKAIGQNEDLLLVCTDVRKYDEIETALKFRKTQNEDEFSFTEFVFLNYRSDRYDASNPHKTEDLARFLLSKGYKDRELIKTEDLLEAIKLKIGE